MLNALPSVSQSSKAEDAGNSELAQEKARTLGPMNNEQQLRTAFLSFIPVSMCEKTVNSLLLTVPTFEFLVRVFNSKNEPCSFGFVRYKTIESLQVLAQILSKVDYKSITDGKFDTLFKLHLDENTQRYIKDYEATNGEDYAKSITGKSLDDNVKDFTSKLRVWFQAHKASGSTSILGVKENIEDKPTEDEDGIKDEEDVVIDENEFRDLVTDHKDEVLAEIKEFRILSIKQQKVKNAKCKAETEKREKNLEAAVSRALEDSALMKNNKPKYSKDDESSDDEDDDGEGVRLTDEQIEQQRKERRAARLEKYFEEEQRRWLARERINSSALERERVRADEQEGKLEHDKKQALRKYAEFKDGGEYETRTLEYYYDHAKWVKSRMQFRERERELDRRDREEEERENGAKKSEEERFLADLSTTLTTADSSGPAAGSVGKIKLSLGSNAAKKQNAPQVAPEVGILLDDSTETAARKKLTIPAIRPAVKIPEEKDELFAWEVKWNNLSENIIEDDLKPVVINLIVESLGVQEDDLIDFILQHVREHKGPQELVSELELVCLQLLNCCKYLISSLLTLSFFLFLGPR